MQIQKIKSKRNQLQQDIKKLVNEFERETSTQITDINTQRVYGMGVTGGFITAIQLDVTY